jgi:hypothetical protein
LLYALVGRPPPEFVWVTSPGAAVPLVRPSEPYRVDGPLSLEAELANDVSSMRTRMDRRIGSWDRRFGWHRFGNEIREFVSNVIIAGLPERRALLWFGQHDAGWVMNYLVHQQFEGVPYRPEDSARLALWATLARSCGWWWPRADRCVIAERPLVIRTEPNAAVVRLHADGEPAVVYPDGWRVYVSHGVRVPTWAVEEPTVDNIHAERNIEVRRAVIERMGWSTYISQAQLTLVGQADDPGNPGAVLRLYDQPNDRNRLLLAINGSVERDGTRRQYGLRVPPWFTDPVDAAAWTYGLTGPQYAQLQRRT